MNIHQFNPGDVITRTDPVYVKQPAEMNHSLGIKMDQEPIPSFNFVGQKLIFRGIANGGINIHVADGYNYHLPLHRDFNIDWSEGWDRYEQPLEVEHEQEEEPVIEKPKKDSKWLHMAISLFIICLIHAWYMVDPVNLLVPTMVAVAIGWSGVVCLSIYFNPSPSSKPSKQ
jgi:hypothetical protein